MTPVSSTGRSQIVLRVITSPWSGGHALLLLILNTFLEFKTDSSLKISLMKNLVFNEPLAQK